MGWLIGTMLAIGSVTAIAAKWLVGAHPAWSTARLVLASAAAFPLLSLIVAIVLGAVGWSHKPPAPGESGNGLVVFVYGMFWFYGLMATVVVGLPTAVVAVRAFR